LKSKQKSISKNKRHLVTIDQISKKTSDAPFGTQLKSKDYAESGIPVIQGRNIKENKFHWNNKKYTSKEKFDSLPRSHCSKGDLIFPKIGTIGNVCILPSIEGNEQCILSTNSMSCSINEKLADPNYIYYYFCQKKIHDYINSTSRGSTQPIFNYGMLKAFSIEIPSLEIQLKVSKILQELDSKIENLQNQNKILEQMAQTIFKSWFVDFDGVTEFEDSELGEIPKGWNVKRVKEIAEFNPENIGKDSIFSEIYYLDTSSVTEGKLTDIQRLAKNDAPSRAKRLVKKNDILISTVRPNLKHYYFIKNPRENLVVSTGFVVVRSKKISPFHLYYLITSDSFTEYLTGVADSHTSAYPSFPSEIIENTKICLPDIESDSISSSFNKILNPMFEKLEYNENQIRSLTKTRDALLPKLMSGEIRV